MTKKEARVVIILPEEFDGNLLKTFNDFPTIRINNGCEGCAFWDKESWDMPCKECKRNCRDYWRNGNDE